MSRYIYVGDSYGQLISLTEPQHKALVAVLAADAHGVHARVSTWTSMELPWAVVAHAGAISRLEKLGFVAVHGLKSDGERVVPTALSILALTRTESLRAVVNKAVAAMVQEDARRNADTEVEP